MENSDAAAVAQVRAGDSDAFRVLVDRHSRSVFRLAFRMTGNEQDAEDLVQETFLRAYRQIARFDGRAGFSTWLYRIAANLIADRWQRTAKEQGNPSAEEIGQISPAEIEEVERRATLFRLVDSLPAEQQRVVILRFVEQKSIKEVAREISKTEGAVKQLQFRAITNLRTRMGGADA